MTRIEFFFDPSCPFCWITSRWILRVSEHREIDVAWRPFSLAIKNDELAGGADDSEHAGLHRDGHRVHRVIAAAAAQGASVIELYTAFGNEHHAAEKPERRPLDDSLIADVLRERGLPAELAAAADDTTYDAGLESETKAALGAVGDDAGVPIIVFVGPDGERRGYFGPVLNALPGQDEALRIWDGLERLAPVTDFYELKRSRPDGGPDTSGTSGF